MLLVFLPIARLSSFCTLELTPTILYKPCSSIPGEGEERRGEETCTDLVNRLVMSQTTADELFGPTGKRGRGSGSGSGL